MTRQLIPDAVLDACPRTGAGSRRAQTGRRPTGCGRRSRRRAGGSSTAAPTSPCRRRRRRRSRRRARSDTAPPTRSRRCSPSPSTGLATVILVATDWPADLERALDALASTSPDGVGMVVVADGPSPEQAEALAAVAARPSRRGGPDDRAARPGSGAEHRHPSRDGSDVVVVLDTSVEPTRRRDHAARAGARRPDGRASRAGGGSSATTCAGSRTRRRAT